MTAKRHYFSRAYYPHEQHFGLVCPTCELGQLVREQPIVAGETAMSVALASDPAMLEPEDYKEWRFATLLRCNNPVCAETALFTGVKKLHTGEALMVANARLVSTSGVTITMSSCTQKQWTLPRE